MPLSRASLSLPLTALICNAAHRCRWLALTLPLFLSAIAGCASAPTVYGERARFSPAFQGYVMARNNGSDDPDMHMYLRELSRSARVTLLHDPTPV